MITGRREFLVTCAGAIVMMGHGNPADATPPNIAIPYGLEEWIASKGAAPATLELGREINSRQVVIKWFGRGFPTFIGVGKRDGIKNPYFHFDFTRSFRKDSALYGTDVFGYEAEVGVIVPLFAELYRVDDAGKTYVRMTNVTSKCPAAVVPEGTARVIMKNSLESPLFIDMGPYEDPIEFDHVKVERFDTETKSVTLSLQPQSSSRKPFVTKRMPEQLVVKEGEVLHAPHRSRAYKLQKIVPDQDIPNVGRLVGWIEIGAEPVATP